MQSHVLFSCSGDYVRENSGGEYNPGHAGGYLENARRSCIKFLTCGIRTKAESRIEYHKQKDPGWADYLTPRLLADELFSGTDSFFSAIYNVVIGGKIDGILQEMLDAEKSKYNASQKKSQK